jgi:hypothetical protein
MSRQWLYGDDKKGPVSSSELKALAKSGQITPADLVWKPKGTRCVPASEVKGLFPRFSLMPLVAAFGVTILAATCLFLFAPSNSSKESPKDSSVVFFAPALEEPTDQVTDLVTDQVVVNYPPVEPKLTMPLLMESMEVTPNLVDLINEKKVKVISTKFSPSLVAQILLEPTTGEMPKYIVPCGTLLRTPRPDRQNLMVMRTCQSNSKNLSLEFVCINKPKLYPAGTYSFERLPSSDPLVKEAERLAVPGAQVKMGGGRMMQCNTIGCKQKAMWDLTEALRMKGIEK